MKARKPKAAPRKRKPGMGGAKGAAFERAIAKQLSLWISGGKSQDLLWRSAGSGGRSTMRRKQTGKGIEYHASDIAPLHPDAAPFCDVFTLECKCYTSIELRQVVYDWGKSTIAKWWAQAQRDAASVKRIPLMVVKENLKPALLVMPVTSLNLLHSMKGGLVYVSAGRVYIVGLDDMLLDVSFQQFRDSYVPSYSDQRSAPNRRSLRRVPLVDL